MSSLVHKWAPQALSFATQLDSVHQTHHRHSRELENSHGSSDCLSQVTSWCSQHGVLATGIHTLKGVTLDADHVEGTRLVGKVLLDFGFLQAAIDSRGSSRDSSSVRCHHQGRNEMVDVWSRTIL